MITDDLVHRLGELLLSDSEVVVLPDWAHLVLVGTAHPGSWSVTGFCCPEQGPPAPAAPWDGGTLAVLEDLRRAMARQDHGATWTACLIHLERADGRFELDFEYDDPSRWEITFENRLERAVQLDPRQA